MLCICFPLSILHASLTLTPSTRYLFTAMVLAKSNKCIQYVYNRLLIGHPQYLYIYAVILIKKGGARDRDEKEIRFRVYIIIVT